MSCQLIHYVHEEHDTFFEVCKGFDALVVRCNPGQIKADGGSQATFDDGMRGLRKLGIQVWPSPDVMEFMGAKDALTKIADMNIGLPDTLAYYDPAEFAAGFKKTMAVQPRAQERLVQAQERAGQLALQGRLGGAGSPGSACQRGTALQLPRGRGRDAHRAGARRLAHQGQEQVEGSRGYGPGGPAQP
eukprot:15896856-Heterocapsa_arctica.AAC.1